MPLQPQARPVSPFAVPEVRASGEVNSAQRLGQIADSLSRLAPEVGRFGLLREQNRIKEAEAEAEREILRLQEQTTNAQELRKAVEDGALDRFDNPWTLRLLRQMAAREQAREIGDEFLRQIEDDPQSVDKAGLKQAYFGRINEVAQGLSGVETAGLLTEAQRGYERAEGAYRVWERRQREQQQSHLLAAEFRSTISDVIPEALLGALPADGLAQGPDDFSDVVGQVSPRVSLGADLSALQAKIDTAALHGADPSAIHTELVREVFEWAEMAGVPGSAADVLAKLKVNGVSALTGYERQAAQLDRVLYEQAMEADLQARRREAEIRTQTREAAAQVIFGSFRTGDPNLPFSQQSVDLDPASLPREMRDELTIAAQEVLLSTRNAREQAALEGYLAGTSTSLPGPLALSVMGRLDGESPAKLAALRKTLTDAAFADRSDPGVLQYMNSLAISDEVSPTQFYTALAGQLEALSEDDYRKLERLGTRAAAPLTNQSYQRVLEGMSQRIRHAAKLAFPVDPTAGLLGESDDAGRAAAVAADVLYDLQAGAEAWYSANAPLVEQGQVDLQQFDQYLTSYADELLKARGMQSLEEYRDAILRTEEDGDGVRPLNSPVWNNTVGDFTLSGTDHRYMGAFPGLQTAADILDPEKLTSAFEQAGVPLANRREAFQKVLRLLPEHERRVILSDMMDRQRENRGIAEPQDDIQMGSPAAEYLQEVLERLFWVLGGAQS